MEQALNRAKALNRETRKLDERSRLLLPISKEELEWAIGMQEGMLRYYRELYETTEKRIGFVEKQIAVNKSLLARKLGRAECSVCHIVRDGKEVDDAFICNVCSGPSPLRGLKK